ncbi:MAG: DJ-1/PfpI family protein [Nanoarchaeota archaeon]|nr:DJ-1/PfpI family protein [Nanoarchaeota archaeon]
MADVLMVIAPDGFRDEEYFHVREELEKAKNKVMVASLKDVAVSSVEKKEVVVDLLIDEADVADYDAMIISGGPGASIYFEEEKILEMCYQTIEQGKILGAICIAPGILARAGVLSGKKATSFESEKSNLDEAGAITSDSHVVVDGQIITADGPQASREFGKRIVEMLNGEVKKDHDNSKEESKEYYPPESEGDKKEDSDDGFPENKPYYDEGKRQYEKRVTEDETGNV